MSLPRFAAAALIALSLIVVPAPPAAAHVSLEVAIPDTVAARAQPRADRWFERPTPRVQPVTEAAAVVVKPKKAAVVESAKPAVKAAKKPQPKKTTVEVATVPASGKAAAIVAYARSKVGGRYVWAAEGPSSFDCSGLVMMALRQVGVSVPHQSGSIAARGRRVPAGQWMPGDILIMPGHVAVYAGGGKMIEAANPSAGIRIAPTRGGYAVRFV